MISLKDQEGKKYTAHEGFTLRKRGNVSVRQQGGDSRVHGTVEPVRMVFWQLLYF